MSRMRAVLIRGGKGDADSLYIGETARPEPSDGEVLVKVKAFGLNRSEISQREGKYPPPPGASKILGLEFSGTVSGLGSGVTEWKAGDEVLGLVRGGAYAEYVSVPQTHIIKKPRHLSWTEAASIPEVWLTAFQALIVIGSLKAGEDVLVHAGASGVGVAASQLAKMYGAKTTTATASTKEKLDWLLSLPNGPTHVVNYKTQDFADEVKRITKDKGADVVIDFVGQSHWQKNIDSLALDGRMTILSLLSGAEVKSFSLSPLLSKRLHIEGSTLRSRSVKYQANLIARFRREVFEHITNSSGDGKLRTYIYKVYPWTAIKEAHKEMEANKNSGKIVAEII